MHAWGSHFSISLPKCVCIQSKRQTLNHSAVSFLRLYKSKHTLCYEALNVYLIAVQWWLIRQVHFLFNASYASLLYTRSERSFTGQPYFHSRLSILVTIYPCEVVYVSPANLNDKSKCTTLEKGLRHCNATQFIHHMTDSVVIDEIYIPVTYSCFSQESPQQHLYRRYSDKGIGDW